jgi:protein tyrosine phosphatase (PTP) superfamily phosphohydrolase (DUF442 family)
MNIRKAYKFKLVNDLVSCSGTLMKVDLESLKTEHYQLLINLLPNDSKYSRSDEKETIEALNIEYYYIPIDWENPQVNEFEIFESILQRNKGKKVHIHCAANYRATAFYGIYALKNESWSLKDLFEFTGSIWQISEYPIWKRFVKNISI